MPGDYDAPALKRSSGTRIGGASYFAAASIKWAWALIGGGADFAVPWLRKTTKALVWTRALAQPGKR
ncbi:hypothetical protein D8M20_12190 [Corynebacterium propinquum]|nr:hypothetical protein [Pseudomonas sp. Q1]RUP88389.1 hypothetical protein D8M20_12190 [Corynebacterium propinquum]